MPQLISVLAPRGLLLVKFFKFCDEYSSRKANVIIALKTIMSIRILKNHMALKYQLYYPITQIAI